MMKRLWAWLTRKKKPEQICTGYGKGLGVNEFDIGSVIDTRLEDDGFHTRIQLNDRGQELFKAMELNARHDNKRRLDVTLADGRPLRIRLYYGGPLSSDDFAYMKRQAYRKELS